MRNLNIEQSLDLINSKKDLLVLDVRNSVEYKEDGHIKGAKLLPLNTLSLNLDEILNYENLPILVYCSRGSRSLQACEILEDNGFNKVYNMVGGYSKWITDGGDNHLKIK